MRIFCMGLLGLILGGGAGVLLGGGLGLIWISVFQTSCFEGLCGYVVFYSGLFGLPLGAVIGAVGLGYIASRRKPAAG
jgi:hypothetical protein